MKLSYREASLFTYLELQLLEILGKDKLTFEQLVKELYEGVPPRNPYDRLNELIQSINRKFKMLDLNYKLSFWKSRVVKH